MEKKLIGEIMFIYGDATTVKMTSLIKMISLTP